MSSMFDNSQLIEINKNKKLYKFFSIHLERAIEVNQEPKKMKKYYQKYNKDTENCIPYDVFRMHFKSFCKKYLKIINRSK